MGYVLLFFMLGTTGVLTDGVPFASQAECEQMRAELPAIIAKHNATPDSEKVKAFAAVCVPLQDAPTGMRM